MWSLEKFEEVFESLRKGGTRYRTEKWVVLAIYGVFLLASLLWALTGIELRRDLEGEMAVETIENLDRHTFTVRNTGNTVWHRVRVVVNNRYLARVESIEAGQAHTLKPEDFQYYYHVPRPWGASKWEDLGESAKPGPHYPVGLEVEQLSVQSREGRVEMTVESDS